MKNLFNAIKKQTLAGKACYLIALIECEGSTPRSSGAYMLVGADGYLYGTIGGGGMEYAAQLLAQQRLSAQGGTNFVKAYDLSPKAGMACGGSCQVQFIYLPANAEVVKMVETGLKALAQPEPWWFLLPLGEGTALPEINKDVQLAGHRGIVNFGNQQFYAEEYNYDGWVYVFGAGHVARELVPLLCHVGFSCAVFDDREEFADAKIFPMAERVEQVDFRKLEAACQLTERDYAVVMTRGHVHDANVERFLLKTPAKYIGIMGSKSKAQLARAALLAEGYSQEQLARVTTPVGLPIGSETPAEIAVSIVAQLIQIRAKKTKF